MAESAKVLSPEKTVILPAPNAGCPMADMAEVEDVEEFWESLKALRLNEKYSTAKLVPVRHLDWGKECFLHDPSGILWHFGAFTLK